VNSSTGVVSMVPEPSTGALMMIGAVGLVALRRLRKV
jgi:PEP-CTERM motif